MTRKANVRASGGRAMTMTLCLMAAGCVSTGSPTAAPNAPEPQFSWRSSAQLISPGEGAPWLALKDPSVVRFNGKYHVFMTTAARDGWHIAHTSFSDWPEAARAPVTTLDRSGIGPGYRAAPQVFYFEPQKLWYLIYQGGPPYYSTTANIEDPLSWSEPRPFFARTPDAIKAATGQEAWLDFWVICDDAACHLFNTDDGGNLFRSQTPLDQFPNGFSGTSVVMSGPRDDIFEGSMHYRIDGTDAYLTVIEAIGPQGRYFRSWVSDRLDGEWRPLADTNLRPFAGAHNVTFDGPAWSEGVSHGELVRKGFDQTLTIDPCAPLQFLYQGLEPHAPGTNYIELPYRLGLLTANTPNPIGAMCDSQAGAAR
ncbi:non-reducing end alpha-L-arabinofuranosidase family hydrolase [Brevundimonas sp.]|uniref:non-reducing end alpha-L-arabinofuranosidase family hydrolase n=1 Tax=Brevundimonas sp. TaxID=1871086 RepID=UPI002D2B5B1D|nr:non-reducing end alpha-L-arabinofuranosidase family hydrolase [Brevundimonas sp.]HYC99482.1 non-reducing end alpha-L-arabinofuranosidase family hydrolase [Brevundimonas sp.]